MYTHIKKNLQEKVKMKNSNKKLHKKDLITNPFDIQCNNESLIMNPLNTEILLEDELLISPPGMELPFDGDLDISPSFDEGFHEDELLISPPGMELPFDGDLDISPSLDEGFHEDELLISPPGMEMLPEEEIPPEPPDLYTEEETIPELFEYTKTETRQHLDYHKEAIQYLDLYRKTRKNSDLNKYYLNMVKYYQCLYYETRDHSSL
jgi:hypothetical protein